jgi:hypothetical protein
VTGISLMGSVGNRGEWQRHASAADGHKVPNQASEKSTSEGGVSARSDRSRADGILQRLCTGRGLEPSSSLLFALPLQP